MRGARGTVALVTGVLALASAGSAAASGSATSAAAGRLVRIGPSVTQPPGAVFHGRLAAGRRLHVAVTLRPRDPQALAAYVAAVSTPGSPDYRRYLTPAQFARRFGANAHELAAARESLQARGLRPGAVSAGGLSIPVVAAAGALDRAFSVSLRRLALPGRRTAIAAGVRPALPASAAGAVQAVLGLDTAAAPRPLLVRSAPSSLAVSPTPGPLAVRSAPGATSAVAPQPCPAALAAGPSQSAYTADQIASAYGFTGLYQSGDGGAGVTVAVYELEPVDPADLATYQSCYRTHARISYVAVDGGAGTGPGSGEAALDIENLVGLAPDANVLVYQGPNSNSGNPGSGPYDTFSQIINQDRAQVITISWGQCEAALGQPDAIAEHTLFEQAAVEGQSVVAASGDNGAEDCDVGGAAPQVQAAVDDPASQPLVTGVGGTSLQSLGPRPTESVWNGYATATDPTIQSGAGGGGVSSFWAMPAAQADAAVGLGVHNPLGGGMYCGNPGGWCREVPDVSADADPQTGYLIYWNGRGSAYGQPAGWQGIGGTSGGAPLWAALLALADASPGCSTSPVGYADPALYRAAGSHYTGDFNDVTTGENDFTHTNGGRYAAGPGYDLATGLGSPDAVTLARALCADTVRLRNPGDQRSALHAAVSLTLHADGTSARPITYGRFGRPGASGLPRGLQLDASTGRISGHPTRIGVYTVRITAQGAEGSSASVLFHWTIGAAPRVSRPVLTRTAGGGPELGFAVAAGRGSPPLSTLTISVPRELRLRAHARGIRLSSGELGHGTLRFTDSESHRMTLTIRLRQPTRAIRVQLRPPTLTTPGGRMAASVPALGRQRLTLGLTDADGGRSRLHAPIPG